MAISARTASVPHPRLLSRQSPVGTVALRSSPDIGTTSGGSTSLLEARLTTLEHAVGSQWAQIKDAGELGTYLVHAHQALAQELATLSEEHDSLCDCLVKAGLLSSLRPMLRASARRAGKLFGQVLEQEEVACNVCVMAGAKAVARLRRSATGPASCLAVPVADSSVGRLIGRVSPAEAHHGGVGRQINPAVNAQAKSNTLPGLEDLSEHTQIGDRGFSAKCSDTDSSDKNATINPIEIHDVVTKESCGIARQMRKTPKDSKDDDKLLVMKSLSIEESFPKMTVNTPPQSVVEEKTPNLVGLCIDTSVKGVANSATLLSPVEEETPNSIISPVDETPKSESSSPPRRRAWRRGAAKSAATSAPETASSSFKSFKSTQSGLSADDTQVAPHKDDNVLDSVSVQPSVILRDSSFASDARKRADDDTTDHANTQNIGESVPQHELLTSEQFDRYALGELICSDDFQQLRGARSSSGRREESDHRMPCDHSPIHSSEATLLPNDEISSRRPSDVSAVEPLPSKDEIPSRRPSDLSAVEEFLEHHAYGKASNMDDLDQTLLPDVSSGYTNRDSQASSSKAVAPNHVADSREVERCACSNIFMADAKFCRKCGKRRPAKVDGSRIGTRLAILVLRKPEVGMVLGRLAGLHACYALEVTARIYSECMRSVLPGIYSDSPVEIYLFGGHDDDLDSPCTTLEMLPLGHHHMTWEASSALPAARTHSTAVATEGAIYLLGGLADSQRAVAWCECFKPDVKRWEQLPSMSVPRHACGAAAVGRALYVVGGLDDYCFDGPIACERFCFGSRRWAPKPGTAMMSSVCVASALLGTLYVAGFLDEMVGCQRLHAESPQWEQLPNAHPPFRPMDLTGATSVGSRLFILGTCVREIRVFEAVSGAWEAAPSTVKLPDDVRWASAMAITSAAGKIYIFGHWGSDNEHSNFEAHDTPGPVAGLRLELGRAGHWKDWALLPTSRIRRTCCAAAALRM